MLLRIDAYPAFAPPDQEPQTFYACLASSSSKSNANADADDANDDTGRIFTVGRKVGDALFADKSVSREHCFLRLVSANKTHQQAVHLDNDSTNTGKTIPPPARPRNAREINACAADEQHECLVLENVGKVGSFIVQERVVRRAATKKDDADSATEDDETDDDEDNSHESQVAAASQAHTVELSPAARAIVADPSKVFLQQVGANESVVLPMSLTDSDNSKPTIVQCGKLGSTLVIRRHVVSICRSGPSKSKLAAAWRDKLHCIGVTSMDTIQEATHLVTATRETTVKQLTAWCRGMPIVNDDYLQALLDRSSPAAQMPDPIKYEPESDGESFWKNTVNPKLLQGCTYFSTKENDELEALVLVLGGTVRPLYTLVIADAIAAVEAVLHEQEKQDDFVHYSCFSVQDKKSRKKLPKIMEQRGVPQVTPRQIAQCVSEQSVLKDISGKSIIGKENERKKDDKEQDNFPRPEDNDDSAVADESAQDSQSQSQVSNLEYANGSKGNASINDLSKPVANEAPKRAKRVAKENQHSPKRKQTVLDVEHAKDLPEVSRPSKKSKTTPIQEEDKLQKRPIKRKQSVSDEDAAEEPVETERPMKKIKASKGEDPCESTLPRQTLATKTTAPNGWFKAAPKGKERRSYLRSNDDIMEATGRDELNEPALTEICKGMVLQPKPFAFSSLSGPNFKRFRKNPVVQQPRLLVKTRAVLPKETEQHRQYEEQQRVLEEQKRKADQLFGDGGGRSRGAAARRYRV